MRVLLIVLGRLALSRPTVFSERLNLAPERPAAVVLLFDNSVSMQYRTWGGKRRLELAVEKAKELIRTICPMAAPLRSSTRVLLAALGSNPLLCIVQDCDRSKFAANALTSRLSEAYRLFTELDTGEENKEATLPRFLYLFTDRTAANWDATCHMNSKPCGTVGVTSLLIDVGPESPVDVAVLAVDQAPRSLVTQHRLRLGLECAAGSRLRYESICKIDGEAAGNTNWFG